jgi:hypothetical protein
VAFTALSHAFQMTREYVIQVVQLTARPAKWGALIRQLQAPATPTHTREAQVSGRASG